MRTAIDRSGRVIIPKPLRDRLGLTGGEPLDVIEVDGALEIRPAPIEAVVHETEDGPVIVAEVEPPPLTDEDVRRTVDRLRR